METGQCDHCKRTIELDNLHECEECHVTACPKCIRDVSPDEPLVLAYMVCKVCSRDNEVIYKLPGIRARLRADARKAMDER